MKNENFKIQLFRFVDVLPYLNTSESLDRHIKEYFGGEDQDVPAVMKWGAKGAGLRRQDSPAPSSTRPSAPTSKGWPSSSSSAKTSRTP